MVVWGGMGERWPWGCPGGWREQASDARAVRGAPLPAHAASCACAPTSRPTRTCGRHPTAVLPLGRATPRRPEPPQTARAARPRPTARPGWCAAGHAPAVRARHPRTGSLPRHPRAGGPETPGSRQLRPRRPASPATAGDSGGTGPACPAAPPAALPAAHTFAAVQCTARGRTGCFGKGEGCVTHPAREPRVPASRPQPRSRCNQAQPCAAQACRWSWHACRHASSRRWGEKNLHSSPPSLQAHPTTSRVCTHLDVAIIVVGVGLDAGLRSHDGTGILHGHVHNLVVAVAGGRRAAAHVLCV